jgi:flagellar hook assembly protein FlgD
MAASAAETPTFQFSLGAAYPNPSDGSASISYTLARQVPAVLRVYNVAGRELRTLVNEEQAAGRQEVQWDGRDNGGRRVSPACISTDFRPVAGTASGS